MQKFHTQEKQCDFKSGHDQIFIDKQIFKEYTYYAKMAAVFIDFRIAFDKVYKDIQNYFGDQCT